VILRSTQPLDPAGDVSVLRGPLGAGDLPVGDVTYERVRERELALTFNRCALLSPHEPFALE